VVGLADVRVGVASSGARSPVAQPTCSQLDLVGQRLLGLLVECDKREQDSSARALSGEQDSVDHALAVRADLKQVAA
jgi:hypothetical protein